MFTQNSQNTRTLSAYLTGLLEYPRWVIEHEVDFTHCQHGGRFDAGIPDCASCQFGAGCEWLDRNRSPTTANASLDELLAALAAAIHYFESSVEHERGCHCRTCSWLREARRFLHSHPKAT